MKKIWYTVPSILFLGLFCWGRILLLQSKNIAAGPGELLLPLLKDLGTGVLFLLLFYALTKINRFAAYLPALVLALLHLANMEYIYALDHVINLTDLSMASDQEFIRGTLFHVSFPLYSLTFTIALMVAIYTLGKTSFIPLKTKILRWSALGGLLLLYGFIAVYASGDWKTGSFVSASLSNTVAVLTFDDEGLTDYPADIEQRIQTTEKLKQGEYLLGPRGTTPKNILMVVMEGIPGAYLPSAQDYLEVSNDIRMTRLQDKIKDHSLVLPNYITHNNQTIRGMYSLISGDYPNLDASTPKAYEYLQLNESERKKLLPQRLKEQGYHTAFIQAANLEYMSKGDFMKAAGYETIIGGESFTHSYIPFGWGPDDKAFFEQSRTFLDELDSKGEPWFATMLTVGTHHPYAVSDEYEDQYSSRKEAAVAYLDEALSDFIDYIDSSTFAKDTLVLFISDESHGVNNQPYGSNWGIFAAYSPEIEGQIVNDGVFGQKDIMLSLLDYADPALDEETTGRSVFRKYRDDVPILFASHYTGDVFYSTRKGEVYQVDNGGQLYELKSKSGEMFGTDYERTALTDKELKKQILTYKNYISRPMSSDDHIRIAGPKDFKLTGGGEEIISDGQFLALPEKSYVDIHVDYTMQGLKQGETVKLVIQDGLRKYEQTIDAVQPAGQVTLRFYNEKSMSGYAFSFKAAAGWTGSEPKTFTLNDLSIDFTPKDAGDAQGSGTVPFEAKSK